MSVSMPGDVRFGGLRLWLVVLASVGFATIATGCNAPFSSDILAEAEDTVPPVLTLDTPQDQSFYTKTVFVSGTVSDSTNETAVPGSVDALRYEIPGAAISESVEVADDGTFSFQFSTTLFTGDSIALQVVATDGNGNSTTVTRSLLYGGSDIASFTAVPGNQSVTLEWDPVPGAAEYTIRNLGESEEITVPAGTSSYEWHDLTNGTAYFFEIESVDGLDQINTSTVTTAIPLSPYTLLPRIENSADGVRLTWRPMPGIDRYVVEKAERIDGPFFQRGVTSDAEFEDRNLLRDRFYYYRVYPEGQDSIKSAPMEAILVPYATTGSEAGDYFGPLNRTEFIETSGNYVFAIEVNGSFDTEVIVLDASDPENLTETTRITSGSLTALDTTYDPIDEILYLALEEAGIQAIDMSNPVVPQILTVATPGNERLGAPVDDASFYGIAAARVGGTPYIFANRYEGTVYAASVSLSGSSVDFTVSDTDPIVSGDGGGAVYWSPDIDSGNSLYVAIENGNSVGYDVIDISNPSSLSRTTGYRVTNNSIYPDAIAATETHVFLGYPTSTGGTVRAVRASNNSTVDASFDYTKQIPDLTIADGILYASLSTLGVEGYLIDGLTSSSVPIITPDVIGSAQQALSVNGYLVVAGLSGIESFELLELIGAGATREIIDDAGANGNLFDFSSVGNDAHFVHLTRLYPLDLSNIESTAGLSSYESAVSGGTQVIFQGNRQIIFDSYDGPERLISATVPGVTPRETYGTSETNANGFHSIGDYTYGYAGTILTIHDTSDLSSFPRLRSIAVDEGIRDIVSQGNDMWAMYDQGIIVYDISDPLAPVELATLDIGAFGIAGHANATFNDMELHNDRLYILFEDRNATSTDGTDDSGGILVFDVSGEPDDPTLLGSYESNAVFTDAESYSKHFQSFEIIGHLAVLSSGFLANNERYEGRIELVNVADPSAIYKIKDLLPSGGYAPLLDPIPDFPESIHVWKNRYVFVYGRQELSYYEL